MFQQVKIAPSILSADFLHMGDSIRAIEHAGAGFVHVDVMDGHFVPNLTMGVPLVKRLKGFTELPLDVHLMIANPMRQIPWFLEAGADIVTVHFEAIDEVDIPNAAQLVHDAGARFALSVKPGTPAAVLEPYIPYLDMVLIMTVEPGFSGQSFMPECIGKIDEVVGFARAARHNLLIEVDGGISEATAPLVAARGADVLVAGNAVYKADDIDAAVAAITQAAESARLEALGA